MNRRLLALCLLLLLPLGLTPHAPAQQAPPDAAAMLQRVRTSLQAGHLAEAIDLLKTLKAAELTPAVEHQVDIELGLLTGRFKPRMGPFLEKQVIDTVVLVDDELTLLRAIAAWEPDVFYPVLIDDGWYSKLFIEAFQPKRVVRLTSGVVLNPGVVAQAATEIIEKHNKRLTQSQQVRPPGWAPPPGVVVIDPAYPQRAAGLALALGRRQPIVTTTSHQPHTHFANEQTITTMRDRILAALQQWNLSDGKSWTAVTFAMDLPFSYKVQDTELAGAANVKLKGPRAVDDLLGRNEDGLRVAVTGRLVGDMAQSTYQAMCSLFLQPSRALLVDDYSTRKNKPAWKTYSLDVVARQLAGRMPVKRLADDSISLNALHQATRPTHPFDFIWINSSGSPRNWTLNGPENATPDDVPIGRAAAFNVVHSFSAADPWDPDTIAGRALTGGAYFYFGSMNEPYLPAFAEPEDAAFKMLAGSPLGMALRHAPGHPFNMPWKLVCLGDPLYSFRDAPAQRTNDPLPIGGALLVDADPPRLDNAEALSPGRLAAAVYDRFAAGDYKAILEQDPIVARRHPIATACYRQAAAERYAKQINADQIDAARTTLTRLLILGGDEQTLTRHTKRWLTEMAREGHKPTAITYLKALARQSLPPASRKTLDDLLQTD